MKKKILWLVVSSLMALSLVMAACGQPTTPTTPTTPTIPTIPTTPTTPTTPAAETPKYGGQLKIPIHRDLLSFDEILGEPATTFTLPATNEALYSGDWTKGPAGGYGTNETNWDGLIDVSALKTGYLAESWEMPTKMEGETATLIFHIRKGVRWALNPVHPRPAEVLVGGREVTVDDVIFSLMNATQLDPRADRYRNDPKLRKAIITSPAPWTVKMEVSWDAVETAISRYTDGISIVPPEVVKQLGDMSNWKLSVGTGPFILTDVVPGSTATMVRNPNYWMKDPIGPGKGNQLPYLDSIKLFVIIDRSTRGAAIRTGKVDWYGGTWHAVDKEEKDALLKTAPQLKVYANENFQSVGNSIAMRVDKPPFSDVRVRRALMMAVDFETIKNDFFGGEAQIITFPMPYTKEYGAAYYGPDAQGQWPSDTPESIKELYSYNPEKAKQLLAEAGYPQGFKTHMIIEATSAEIDFNSIIVDMWAKVGVDVELQPKETAAFANLRTKREFDEMIAGISAKASQIYRLRNYYGDTVDNYGRINDPVVNAAYPKIQENAVLNRTEADRLHKELTPYVLEQAWIIPRVSPYVYTLWWPWLKNYSGEHFVGFQHKNFYNWVWIDQELKKSMGY